MIGVVVLFVIFFDYPFVDSATPKSLKRYSFEQGSKHVSALTIGASSYFMQRKLCRAEGIAVDGLFDDDWLKEKAYFGPGAFGRLDEKDDAKYYEMERFVEHIDERAVNALVKYHDSVIAKESEAQGGRPLDVLDLCSSWTSHVTSRENLPVNMFWGLGMKDTELAANGLLTKRTVHDLNNEPRFASSISNSDNSVDVVLLQLSVDYLTRPVEVFQEVGRLLRPGGSCHVTFSNRVFIDKVVGIWSGKSDDEHCEIVGDYFKASGAFSLPPTARDLILENRRSLKGKGKDPLYVVSARKRAS